MQSFDDYPLAELVDCIDWTPFFQTWELSGRYPAILDDPKQGEAARSLFADAQAMLKQIVDEKWFRARAVIGFWPANAVGDDIAVYADDKRTKQIATFHTLRQQLEKREGRHNVALSDFIAPKTSGVADYIGAFVVTAGIGEDVIADRFKHANDDYSSILVKALADRLAEAFAERLHQRVRKEFWGYAPDEALAQRRSDRREVSGHPPGAGLSRAARSHREGDAVPAARRGEFGRREADRELCDVAGLVGVGALLQPPRKPSISASARSSSTRSRTMRRARAGRLRKPNAGWRRS